jgi:hypothetical protein
MGQKVNHQKMIKKWSKNDQKMGVKNDQKYSLIIGLFLI